MRKLSNRRVILIGSSSIGIGAAITFIAVIIPLLLSSFTESKANIGIIMALGPLVGMIIFPLAASCSDRISTPIGKRTPFMLCGIAIAIISILLCSQANKLSSIIFYLAGIWIGINIAQGPKFPLVSDIVGIDQRGKAFASLTFFWVIGALLMNSVGGILYGINTSFAFYFVGLLLLISGIIILNIQESSLAVSFKKKVKVKHIEKIRFKMKLRVYLAELLMEKEPIKFIALMFLFMIPLSLVFPFWPLFFKDVLHIPDYKIPLLLAIPILLGLPATIIYGHLIDKFNRKRLLYFSLAFQIIVLIGFAFVRNVIQAIALMAIATLFSGSNALINTAFSNIIPASRKGQFWGLRNISNCVAWFIAPPLGGFLIDLLSYRAVFLIAGLSLASLTFFVRFVKISGYTFDSIAHLIDFLASKDKHSRMHYQKTSNLAAKIGQKLELNEKELQILESAGFLYDIGKIKIPESVLNKPGSLTAEERDVLRRHIRHTRDVILRYRKFDAVAEVAYYHHERWDGQGYPAGLKGEEIPLLSRILAVVDAYQAMISDRPYRKALSMEEAKKELVRNSGTQFDPHIVGIFIEILNKEKQKEAMEKP